jgi:hypothetical protein
MLPARDGGQELFEQTAYDGYPACVDLAGFADQFQRIGSLLLAGMGTSGLR